MNREREMRGEDHVPSHETTRKTYITEMPDRETLEAFVRGLVEGSSEAYFDIRSGLFVRTNTQ